MTGIVGDLRTARAGLRTAIKALPAPVDRTAAQRRDALIMRRTCLLIQAQLGVAGAADRDVTES